MRIQVKGRNAAISDELHEHVVKRFRKVARQVSELAELDVELWREDRGKTPDCWIAEADLRVKGLTLRAREESDDPKRSVKLCAQDLGRQVKRHRDKRRARRRGRAAKLAGRAGGPAEPAL